MGEQPSSSTVWHHVIHAFEDDLISLLINSTLYQIYGVLRVNRIQPLGSEWLEVYTLNNLPCLYRSGNLVFINDCNIL